MYSFNLILKDSNLRNLCFNKSMKKILMTLLLTFCIGCTYTLLNETNMNVSAKSTKETIMIDAGHGGYDVGSISNFDDYEKDINLDIALLVGKQLKSMAIMLYIRVQAILFLGQATIKKIYRHAVI